MEVRIETIDIGTKSDGGYWIENNLTGEGVAVTKMQMRQLVEELFKKVF